MMDSQTEGVPLFTEFDGTPVMPTDFNGVPLTPEQMEDPFWIGTMAFCRFRTWFEEPLKDCKEHCDRCLALLESIDLTEPTDPSDDELQRIQADLAFHAKYIYAYARVLETRFSDLDKFRQAVKDTVTKTQVCSVQ